MSAAEKKAAAENAANSLAEKQLVNALQTVQPLRDVDFFLFRKQVERVALKNSWHSSILDHRQNAPAHPTAKYAADVRAAYTLITTKSDGSRADPDLERVADNDANAAWRAVKRRYVSDTPAGRQRVDDAFTQASMASTNTTIGGWIATVNRLGRDKIEAGGTCSEEDRLTRLLSGLLPEFKEIKNLLNHQKGVPLTYASASDDLLDWAMNNNCEDLKKGSARQSRAFNVHAEDKKSSEEQQARIAALGKEQCHMYTAGKCRFGANCYRRHDGPGGCTPGAAGTSKPHPSKAPPPKASCNFCGSPGHSTLNACESFLQTISAGRTGVPDSQAFYHASPAAPAAGSSGQAVSVSGQARVHPAYSFNVQARDAFAPGLGTVEDAPEGHAPESSSWSSVFFHVLLLVCMFGVLTLSAALRFKFLAVAFIVVAGTVPAAVNARAVSTVHTTHSARRCFDRRWIAALLALLFALLVPCVSATELDDPLQFMRQWACVRPSAYLNQCGQETPSGAYEWCSDSGTNRFVTNDITDFVPSSVIRIPTDVAVGGGTVTSPCTGTVLIKSLDHNHVIECQDVLLLPNCAQKLLPAYQFLKKKCKLTYDGDTQTVHLVDSAKAPILSGKEIGGLYYFHCQTLRDHGLLEGRQGHQVGEPSQPQPDPAPTTLFGLPVGKTISAAGADFSRRLLECHWAYGHLNFDKLRKLLGLKRGDDPDCPACTIALARKKALSKNARPRSTRPCHRMFLDLGFTAGNRYMFQLYVDDHDRVSYLDVIESKTEVLAKWVDLKIHLENDMQPWKFAFIKTDEEPIYSTPAWEEHCKTHGLTHEKSGVYRHDQMGVVERAMQTVGTSFRCMMITGNAPERCIPSALRFANIIRNYSPTKANNGLTPMDKRAGKRLPINRRLLRGPLFCLAFAHVDKDKRPKHGDRGVACVYFGYIPMNNTYHVMEWHTGREYYSADLTFYPAIFPFRANPQRVVGNLNRWDDLAPHLQDPVDPAEVVAQRKSLRQRGYRLSGGQPLVDIPDIDVPPSDAAVHVADDGKFSIHNFGPDPRSMAEALQMHDADEWIVAELKEKESIKQHDVYDVVPRSEAAANGKRIFKPRPVLKRKFNPPDADHPLGSLDKHKCRLTVAAYTRMLTEGVDYKEKHAGTVRWNAIKVLFAIAVREDYDIVLFDISTFFLYGVLDEPFYMEIPDRWEEDGKERPHYIWKLKRSLYGLPHAPNRAQAELKQCYAAKGEYKATAADDCVYVSTDNNTGVSLSGTHVDDIFHVGDTAGTDKLERTLRSKFDITVNRNPTHVTKVQLVRDRRKKWAKLHQTHYTTELLDSYDMLDSHPVDTPMDAGTAKTLMLLPDDQHTPVTLKAFQGLVGSLIWLQQRTRPDLNYVVCLLSRFLRCASSRHLELAKNRVLKYLNGTRDLGISFYSTDADWKLTGSADADLAGDLKTSRSVLSTNTTLGTFGCISSRSALERKVCTSTGQAETYSFGSLCKEIIWDRLLLKELGYPQEDPTPAYSDNDGVIIQSTKAVNHATAKHYRISQAFIRQLGEDGVVKAIPVDTAYNSSDLGTKPLAFQLFSRHRGALMGPQTAPGST